MFWVATLGKILSQIDLHQEANSPDSVKNSNPSEKIGLEQALKMF